MNEACLPRFEVDEQRRNVLLPALQAVASHPAAARLCQSLALTEGFSLNFMACESPLVAQALILWLQEAVPKVRGEDVKMVRIAPRRSDEARTATQLAREIFDELDTEDPIPHALFLDATDSRSDDRQAWLSLFQRLNERRNHLEVLGAPLTLLLPLDLDEKLPFYAPDLWSIRSVSDSLDVAAPLLAPRSLDPSTLWPRNAEPPWFKSPVEALIQRVEANAQGLLTEQAPFRLASPKSVGLRRTIEATPMTEEHADEILHRLLWQASLESSPLELSKLLVHIAEQLILLEDRALATQLYRRAILPLREGGNPYKLVEAKTSLAKLLIEDEPREAQEILLKEVLPFYEENALELERAATLQILAETHREMGAYATAMALLRAALEIYERRGHRSGEASTLGQLAELSQRQGLLDEALRLGLRQAPLAEDPLQEAWNLESLAELYAARGDVEEAIQIYERHVLPAYQRLGARSRTARARRQLAELTRRLSRSL